MGRKKVVAAVLCGVGALAVVGGICGHKQIANGIKMLTTSPEEYFRYVEEMSAEETLSSFGNYYELVKEAYNYKEDITSEGKLTVSFGEGAEEFFDEVSDVDVSKLSELGLSWGTTVNNGARTGEVSAAVSVNEKNAVSGTLWYDIKEEELFAKVPELSEQLLTMDLETLSGDDFDTVEETFELLEAVYAELPDKKTVESMAQRYWMAGISCIDDVEEEKDELSAEGVSKKYTKLTTVLDGEDMYEILEAITEEMLKDKELETLIIGIAEALDEEDSDDIYEEFCQDLEDFLEECEDVKDFDGEIKLSVWVDNTGSVVGRYLEIEDEAEFFYAMPKKGSKFGYEASLEIEGVEISLKGEGKERSNKLSGVFQLKVLGDRVAEFELEDFNTKDLKEGKANGTVIVRPLGEFEESLKDIEDETGYKVKDPALVLTMDAKKNISSMAIENNGKTIVKVVVEKKETKAKTVSMPEDAEALELTEENALQWFKDSNLKDVLEGVEDAGVPSEWLEDFDDMFDYMEYETAMTYLEEGEYQKAKETFFALGDYDDAEDFVFYCEAKLQYEAGNYEDAVKTYDENIGYFWYDPYFEEECIYKYAEGLLEEGAYEEAADYFLEYYYYDEYYYARAMQYMEDGEYADAEWMLLEASDYAPAEEAQKECNYQLGLKAMNAGDYYTAKEYFSELTGYKDVEEKLAEMETELGLIQMPEHQLYPMNYKDYVEYVTLPAEYLGIPIEQVTDEDIDEYISYHYEGAMSTGAMDDATREFYREKCEEEKYTYALIDYLLTNSEVTAWDEAGVKNKAKIDLLRLRNQVLSYGYEWEEYLELAEYTEEELLSLFEEDRKSTEQAFLICYAVAKAEGMQVTEEEFDYFVADYSEDFGITTNDFLLVNPKEVLDDIFLIEKAMLYLIEQADIK